MPSRPPAKCRVGDFTDGGETYEVFDMEKAESYPGESNGEMLVFVGEDFVYSFDYDGDREDALDVLEEAHNNL